MRMSVFRQLRFNAAHRLHNPAWSEERNKEIFGLCNKPNYHGHNYEVIVRVTGEIDPETGFVLDLKILADLMKEWIEERYDHKNLNLDVAEFKDLNPTAEHICYHIWLNLRAQLDERFDLGVRLYETPRNFVEYPAVD